MLMFGVLLQLKLHLKNIYFSSFKTGQQHELFEDCETSGMITSYHFTENIFVCILIGRILPKLFRNVFFLNGILVLRISIFASSCPGTRATADKHGATDLQINYCGLLEKLRHLKTVATLQKC